MAAALSLFFIPILGSSSGADTHRSFRVTYSYSCCSWKLVNTQYRPGDRLTTRWIPVPDSSPANLRLSLRAWIVGPFPNVNFLKHVKSATPGSGLIKVSAKALTVSNSTPQHPVSVIDVPIGAKSGYYNLWTEIVWLDGSGSGTGASVIHISG